MKWSDLWRDIYGWLLKAWTVKGLGPEAVAVTQPLGSGYQTPQPPVDIKESRDLAHCEPDLVRRYLLVKEEFARLTGMCLFETCTWRSRVRQAELYDQGRSLPGQIVTNIDGIRNRSRHNFYPSQAIDVCVDKDPGPGKIAVWEAGAYAPLGPLCAKHGLKWGGDFKHLKDYPHVQLPDSWDGSGG